MIAKQKLVSTDNFTKSFLQNIINCIEGKDTGMKCLLLSNTHAFAHTQYFLQNVESIKLDSRFRLITIEV